MMNKSFIEAQFPVSKLSKESYKERKSNNSQTLTGLGKWWGRKPLVLVRATIIGLLLPSTDDADGDLDIFLKLMTMDEEGIICRRNSIITPERIAELLSESDYGPYFQFDKGKWAWKKGLGIDEKQDLQTKALLSMGYDEQLTYCARPEQIEGPSKEAWKVINAHCGTKASNLNEWVEQMGEKQFGHTPRVGDAFCGGGSIPFEAARIGCEAYGSDLNPVAALLTWAGLNLIGGGEEVQKKLMEAQKTVFEAADRQITEWGIEHNEKGWRADAYLYCVEVLSPATGYLVPLSPSWVISEKFKVCGVLRPDHENRRYDIEIVYDADNATFDAAKNGTFRGNRLICPETGQEFSIVSLRGDITKDGERISGLRMWKNDDLVPRSEDVFQERLYFIRYEDQKGKRHYCSPSSSDLEREQKVLDLLKERFQEWQEKGFIPSAKIIPGYNTEQPIRERGWTYWHHLFNPRQLLITGYLAKFLFENFSNREIIVYNILGIGRFADWNTRLCRYGTGAMRESIAQTFFNQALNTLFNYGCKAFHLSEGNWFNEVHFNKKIEMESKVELINIQEVSKECDFWITDPPYSDAINYHEIGDFFLAWYEKHIKHLFKEWYSDSKSALAIKGKGSDFNLSMVEAYSNLAHNMPKNGAQVVMFTHQDSKVWADLALILWASGLRVTAAWTIQTETDAGGIKKGNYVQGTVIMVLRKQLSEEVGFLTDIQPDIEAGVKKQIDFMRALDNGDDPNFADADYQLAAYAAALRELTAYKRIGEIDVEQELSRERKSGQVSEIEKIIESAVRVAMDYLVPKGMAERNWRKLHPEERFYLKGLEIEQGGEYRSGVYTEMARGYGLHEYKHLLNTTKANETRLSTASEFKNKELGDDGFGGSLTRQLLFAIHETVVHENPQPGRNWLATEWKNYWEDRALMIQLLEYILSKCAHIPHWKKDTEAAILLRGYLENDTPT
jgi:putative DNA methylase